MIKVLMEFYAHRLDNFPKGEWQKLKEHLDNVSLLCAKFAKKFGKEELGKIIGLFHDIGKYSAEFQKRLTGGASVDHSSAGAVELVKREIFKPYGEKILAFCTMGHHSGLPDNGSKADDTSYLGRLRKKIPDYSGYKNDWDEKELEIEFCKSTLDNIKLFEASFLTRMLFSCLVDADWLDTETFVSTENIERGCFETLESLLEKFNNHIAKFKNPKNQINIKRQEILQECLAKSCLQKGFYKLTVPTGGGKTICSMAFALNHAIKNAQDRIIYTIPFTSVIEQNAEVFRKIFGEENVLEHHSNFIFETEDADETLLKLKFASQNWDAPIITTTNVQFFESLFSNRPSKCRKLHNIANSVIVMDEAQALPINFLKPCVMALEELVKNYNCTVILLSATQPALEGFSEVEPKEIISDPKELESHFKRVEVKIIPEVSDDELVKNIIKHRQMLAIVNTKKHAKELFYRLKDEEGTFHLSTSMCPIHRKKIISHIKERLKYSELTTRVISTQLIEAGVDIDFPFVYRSFAGLDSIIQAAGRANRNGLFNDAKVYVFQSAETYAKTQGYLNRTAVIGEMVLNEFVDNPICREAIESYFERLYKIEDTDKKGIIKSSKICEFKTVAKNFKLIEDNTLSIIIPYDKNAQNLIQKLNYAQFPKGILKQLQPYVVNVYEKDFDVLQSKGKLKNIKGIAHCLIDNSVYYKDEGLSVNKESEAIFI